MGNRKSQGYRVDKKAEKATQRKAVYFHTVAKETYKDASTKSLNKLESVVALIYSVFTFFKRLICP